MSIYLIKVLTINLVGYKIFYCVLMFNEKRENQWDCSMIYPEIEGFDVITNAWNDIQRLNGWGNTARIVTCMFYK